MLAQEDGATNVRPGFQLSGYNLLLFMKEKSKTWYLY